MSSPHPPSPPEATPPSKSSSPWGIALTQAVAAFVLALTFGTFASSIGIPPWAACLMSLLVFSGSAQFAFATTIATGGSFASGIGSAVLLNARFIPMAASSVTALRGGRLRRALEAQLTLDVSWASAQRPDGTVDRSIFMTSSLVQFPAWVAGTAVGAYLAPDAETMRMLGLDVVFPAFFAMMLAVAVRNRPELKLPLLLCVFVAGAALAFLPAGTALLAGSIPGLVWGALRSVPREREAIVPFAGGEPGGTHNASAGSREDGDSR